MIHSSQNTSYIIITLLICVLCTQATRWFPFLLFGGKQQLSETDPLSGNCATSGHHGGSDCLLLKRRYSPNLALWAS